LSTRITWDAMIAGWQTDGKCSNINYHKLKLVISYIICDWNTDH